MHLVSLKEVVAGIVAGYTVGKFWWMRIEPILTPIIKEAEQMALDGFIDKEDKKKLVMDTVAALEANGTIKLDFLEKMMVGLAVDYAAKRLPDWKVTTQVKEVIAGLPK